MTEYAHRWLHHAHLLREGSGRLERVLRFSYEELCDDTHAVKSRIEAFLPEVGTLTPEGEFEVHSALGRRRNPITNANPAAVARLDAGQRGEISLVLGKDPALLEHFGYQLRTG
jgi:hypothetical protein